jgi:hypothetical protein
MAIDAALDFVESGESTGGITTHSALRTLSEEIKRLRDGIACAANALTDSIQCSGNDAATNMHFVRKLKALLDSPNIGHEPRAGESPSMPSAE